MKIGLIDVDGHNYPNLALMKTSAYHKSMGDDVEWCFAFNHYDTVYMSKVFTFTPDYTTCINADKIVKGGTGYDLQNILSEEIEHIYPDYSLYNKTDTAYGFLTRGCPRHCPFCIVSEKEGERSTKVADLSEFWNGQKNIELLDPNTLACKDRTDLLKQIINSKATVNFNQGLDIRFMNDEIIELMQQIKIKYIHFAWDRKQHEELIIKNLKNFKEKTNCSDRNTIVYVLVNFETEWEYDVYRIKKLKELGYAPYVMIFEKDTCNKKYKHLQRYVNNRFIYFSKTTLEEYLKSKKG